MLDGRSTQPQAHSRVSHFALIALTLTLGLIGFIMTGPAHVAGAFYAPAGELSAARQSGLFFASLVPAAHPSALASAGGGVALLIVALVGLLLLLGMAIKSSSK